MIMNDYEFQFYIKVGWVDFGVIIIRLNLTWDECH